MLRLKLARDSMIDFAQITSPHPDDPDDSDRSIYKAMKHHRALAVALQEVEKGAIPRLIVTVPPRHGKSLAHETPILTPLGWRTHGDLRPGDFVFGPDGKPVEVIAISPDVDEVVPVTFTNGETVKCHLNHEWTVYDRNCRKWVTLETRDIVASGLTDETGDFIFHLPETPDVDLLGIKSPKGKVFIAKIGSVEKGGARSIQVAREDGLYLCGRKLNVTHNTEIIAKKFIPWYMARDPYRSCIFATYNEIYAGDVGADVRNVMAMDPAFKQVFPDFSLRKGGSAKGRLQTFAGGLAVFVGRGGAITGRGADLLIIDDLLKDAEEAESPTIREKCWEWFTKVAMTRLMSVGACVVIVMTRWHEDDVVGRLTDPSNPCYSHEEASKWKVINLPAIAEEDDPLGREPGEVLWPERFSIEFLEAQKRLNPRGFSALYQQRPTPEDGSFFLRDWIQLYDPSRVNHRDLRIFAASDHAVGKDKNKNDRTVLMIVGVDSLQNIYLLDCWIGRAQPDVVVERMIDLMQMYKPIAWWAEKGHISQSIGPFLYKRMLERNVYCVVDEVHIPANKEQRAQSIRGRLAMKKVYFPRGKSWTTEGVEEMMKFPAGRHDDFVDTLAYVGLKLMHQFGPGSVLEEKTDLPKVGTLAWVKYDSEFRKRQQRLEQTGGF